jgi:rod shape-determining protein MreD
MKKNIIILIAVIFSTILEVSFLPSFFSLQHVPSLVLLVVILFSIREGFEKNWKWVLLAGIIFDLLSFGRLGVHSFSFLLISWIASLFSEKFFISQKWQSFFMLMIVIFISSALNDFLIFVFSRAGFFFSEKNIGSLYFLGSNILFRALYNIIVGAIFYNPIEKLQVALKN